MKNALYSQRCAWQSCSHSSLQEPSSMSLDGTSCKRRCFMLNNICQSMRLAASPGILSQLSSSMSLRRRSKMVEMVISIPVAEHDKFCPRSCPYLQRKMWRKGTKGTYFKEQFFCCTLLFEQLTEHSKMKVLRRCHSGHPTGGWMNLDNRLRRKESLGLFKGVSLPQRRYTE